MGAYAPWTGAGHELGTVVRERILEPVVAGLAREGSPMIGCLYAGLMVTGDGPHVIEFNGRFGDPETEVLVPLLRSDLASLMLQSAKGALVSTPLDVNDRAAVGVMLCSGGYPGPHRTGDPIHGIDRAEGLDDVVVFHAGTSRDADGTVRTAGGRVLCVTASGSTLRAARERAYEAAALIEFRDRHLRRDIAARPATLARS
jgi:phosphoribosylamine--glycine ligase